jgi:coenzyme F420 hydrogenase subunit delta
LHNNDDTGSLPDWYCKPVLVMGCGNPLMGDDGFGPAVAAALESSGDIPDDVHVEDAGTSAREILFPMVLSDTPVRHIIIVDAVDFADRGRSPGELFEISLEDIPFLKMDDFSMHQVPSSNLLRDLRDKRNVKITILACQIQRIPDEVDGVLSDPVKAAIPGMCELVAKYWGS